MENRTLEGNRTLSSGKDNEDEWSSRHLPLSYANRISRESMVLGGKERVEPADVGKRHLLANIMIEECYVSDTGKVCEYSRKAVE